MNSESLCRFNEQLLAYAARYPHESACVERFQKLAEKWPHCLRREQLPAHLTGSAWAVDAGGTRVALVHHKKLDRWLQPGGHADGDEDLLGVAKKELFEETGLTAPLVTGALFDLDIHEIPERATMPRHLHYDVRFAFRLTGEQALQVSDESNEAAWIPLGKEFDRIADASLMRMKEKWFTIVSSSSVQ